MKLFVVAILAASIQVGNRSEGPRVGVEAPAVKLRMLEADKTFSLADNFRKRATVLIFGSCT